MSRIAAIASLSTATFLVAAIAVPAALPLAGRSHMTSPAGSHTASSSPQSRPAAAAAPKAVGGFVLERDAQIAREEPGTHKGGGQTIGYSFFKDVPNLAMVFRKRAFKPGSAIGYHEQKEDEIYYVLSGRGLMTIDGGWTW